MGIDHTRRRIDAGFDLDLKGHAVRLLRNGYLSFDLLMRLWEI